MRRLELNHWNIKDNELSISLMRFYTSIKICKNDQFIFYNLFVKDNEDKTLSFNFYTLEDAILFTEKIIYLSHDTNEVLEKYILLFENKEFNGPNSNKNVKILKKDTI